MKAEAYLVIISFLFQSPWFVVSTSPRRPQLEHFASRVARHLLVDRDDLPSSVPHAAIMARAPAEQEDPALANKDEEHGPSLFHHRKLQLTGTCKSTYFDLWEKHPALMEVYRNYLINQRQTLVTLSVSDDVCSVVNANNDFVCDFDVPIDGETEFRSACTTAGGQVVTFSVDATCTLYKQAGGSNKALYDYPEGLECIPGTSFFDSCEDQFRETHEIMSDKSLALVELALSQLDDVSSASCVRTGGSISFTIEANDGAVTTEEGVRGQNDGSNTQEDEIAVQGQEEEVSTTQDDAELNNGSTGSGSSNAFSTNRICWILASFVMMGVSLRFGSLRSTRGQMSKDKVEEIEVVAPSDEQLSFLDDAAMEL